MSTQVLLVGSNPDIMAMVTESLESHGLSVTSNLNPDEAINILASKNFDAVVVSPAIPNPTRERLILEIRLVKPGIAVVQPSDPNRVSEAIDAALTAQVS